MRQLLLSTALTALLIPCLPVAATAESLALILGTERYDLLDRVPRAEDVVDAGDSLEDLGFRVIALADGRADSTTEALSAFLQAAPEAERVLVVLSGRFASDGTRTWYLTADSPAPGILSLGDAIPVDSILQVLARAQGRAVLMLGREADGDTVFDPWLREGIGDLSIPQGVTVLSGEPREVSRFLADSITLRGGDLAELVIDNGRIRADGFLPSGFRFVPEDAQPEIEPSPEDPQDTASQAVQDALWEGTQALDTVEAYQNYLERFPTGANADAAKAAITAIRSEPNREYRLAEEALGLGREQRREIQRNLTLLSFNTRGIDGIFGNATRNAIINWQQQNGFEQTSYLSAEQIARIEAQAARRAVQLEAEAARQQQIAAEADRGFWEETGARGDEAGLRTYLNRYPDGLFAEIAIDDLSAIEAAKRDEAAAEDRSAWDAARDENTVPAYRAYLRNFPEGAFRTEAEQRIDQIRADDVDATSREAARAEERALGLTQPTARSVEARLEQLGLNPGTVDGDFDQRTRRAIRNYQRDRELTVTGFLNEATLVRLLADSLANP
jgi:peptidoglycan hydrolase-like protein with peptidoglycan-binding domain